jgi:alpha-L-arabinofuranosidase
MLSHHRPDEVLATTVTLSREHGKPPLFALAGVDKGAGEVVLKVVNRSGERMQVKLVLEGLSLAGERGTAVTLSHSSPWEENSLSDPELIVPRRSEVGLENGQYVFEAYSLTVLRLRLK